MSVLYKALQKAAKDNEQHQAATVSFDAERLAGSGVIRSSGGRRVSWRIAAVVISGAFIAAMGVAYYLTSSETTPPPRQTAMLAPPVHIAPPAAPAPSAAPAAAAPTPATAPGVAPPVDSAAKAVPPMPAANPSVVAANPAPVAQVPAAPEVAAVTPPVETPPARAAVKPMREENVLSPPRQTSPMPVIADDSPARMLNPPISIHRNQMDLEGVGNAVQVRQVSQAARDTVGMAYSALIRGEYDTALGFYDQALKDEPTSVLALLGRGTALQKLGRKDEARLSYERALKVNPDNREALSNLIALEGERAPGEALNRLADLERQYPSFSPIKAQMGLIYARMGDFDGALDYFRRALAVTPDAPMYLYNMALVLDRMGQNEQAVSMYEQVLSAMSGGRNIPELSAADIQRRVTYLRSK